MTTKLIRIVGEAYIATIDGEAYIATIDANITKTVTVDTTESDISIEGYGPRSDIYVLQNNNQSRFTDIADMVDIPVFGTTRVADEDQLNVLDSAIILAVKVADTDTFTTTDIFVGDDSIIQIDKRFNEQILFDEIFNIEIGAVFPSESVSILDNSTVSVIKIVNDTLVATDGPPLFSVGISEDSVDTTTCTDIFSFGITSVLTETASILDSLAISNTKSLAAELITVSDTGGVVSQSYGSEDYFSQAYTGSYSTF
jgi:hypothetical protein